MTNNGKNFLRNIPNMISTFRILLVGVFAVCFIKEKYVHSLITYAAAFLSDVADGYLARRNNWVTPIGKLLDPLADKLMLITALICFTVHEWIPAWILITIALKELAMCVCGGILYRRGIVVEADKTGKLATGLWTVGIIVTLLGRFSEEIHIASQIILVTAVIVSCIALLNYTFYYYAKATEGNRT